MISTSTSRFNPLTILTSAADMIADGMAHHAADSGSLAASLAVKRVSEIAASDGLAADVATQRIIKIADSDDIAAGLATQLAGLALVAGQREAVIHGLKMAAPSTRKEMIGMRRQQLHVETVGSKTLQLLQNVERLWEPVNIESEINKHVKESELADGLIDMLATRPKISTSVEAEDDVFQGCRVPAPITTEVERLLETAHDWSWDCGPLHQATGGQALSTLTYWVLHTMGMLDRFVIDDRKLMAFTRRMELTYGNHPYHNNRHATNVLQMMFKMVTAVGVFPNHIDSIGMLSCVVAAVVHDFEHTGFTNEYLISTTHEMAIRHNDVSPQEQHHVSRASDMMNDARYGFLGQENWRTVRRQVIPMVLATDIKRHFGVLSEFNTGFYGRSDESKGDITQQILIKIADLSHLSAPWLVHKVWVDRLQEEYFLQGDAEIAKGLPVTPFMKRDGKKGLSTSQVGFMDVVANPLFKAFVDVFPSCDPIMTALKKNYDCWMEVEAPN